MTSNMIKLEIGGPELLKEKKVQNEDLCNKGCTSLNGTQWAWQNSILNMNSQIVSPNLI